MSVSSCVVVISFLHLWTVVSADHQDELLNKCIDGRYHKSTSGPEKLEGACSVWSTRSCCNTATAAMVADMQIPNSTFHSFSWDHCGVLSDKCRSHFVQDLCFYECSPNTGPWIVKDTGKKLRKSRFRDIPICKTDCDAWFSACKDDMTCTDNWGKNFNFSGGINHCPKDAGCKKFSDVFQHARQFCENVFDHSFKYTSDEQPCMRLWFNSSIGNPNDRIAEWKADMIHRYPGTADRLIQNYVLPWALLSMTLFLIL